MDRRQAGTWLALGLLTGCAHRAEAPEDTQSDAIARSPWAQASRIGGAATGQPSWSHRVFSGRKPTRYTASSHAGRAALLAESDSGNSAVRLLLDPALPHAERLAFSWWVPGLNVTSDMAEADVDDAVVRIILTFDGDRGQWSARDHMLSELSQLLTGEPLPYATLMYVWDHDRPVGSVVPNPHTRRIRKLVVESGARRLGQWVDHERDIRSDFIATFGEPPGSLTGVGVMTDSNNTKASVKAWYGPLTLTSAAR